jgi:hypothetical protein
MERGMSARSLEVPLAVLSDFLGAWIGSCLAIGREGFNGNRNQQNSLSTMEHGKVEIGADILLRIRRRFGKSIEWPLTG